LPLPRCRCRSAPPSRPARRSSRFPPRRSQNYPRASPQASPQLSPLPATGWLSQGIKPALLIVDTIFSSDGVRPDPAGFLAPAAAAIRARGGLFLADEVQPGFGRTGSHFWGFQRHGLIPDMVSMGKPMGNGYPMAGLVLQPEIHRRFRREVALFQHVRRQCRRRCRGPCRPDVIRDEGLMQNAATVGAAFAQGLRDLAKTHDSIGETRAAGLFLGTDILTDGQPDGAKAGRLVNNLRREGILISATGTQGHILKIRPPLPFSQANVDQFLTTLDRLLAAG
jgi:4-aminobutyrate aminotransferase-like enzyme